MNNFTLLETILIIYILFNWILTMMFAILPKRVADKVSFIFIIICPPLIIGVIGDLISKLIKEKHDKRKKMVLNCFYQKDSKLEDFKEEQGELK